MSIEYRRKILEKAIAMSADGGFTRLTRDSVAFEAGVAAGMVNKCFGTMEGLRRAVVSQAVITENLEVIAQGLAVGYEEARRAPAQLKTRALAMLGSL